MMVAVLSPPASSLSCREREEKWVNKEGSQQTKTIM